VRDLIARYNANADTGRFDEVVELFAPDAVLELPDEVHEGRDAIAAMFRSVRDRVIASAPTDVTPHLRHYTSTVQIDVDDAEHARSRCYFAVLMPHGLDHWGRYVDDFVRSSGTWRFARRRVTMDGRRAGGSVL
jgi:3-phenylpropionate/cinnamic acid dioxygenase small subunit